LEALGSTAVVSAGDSGSTAGRASSRAGWYAPVDTSDPGGYAADAGWYASDDDGDPGWLGGADGAYSA
jgi:hypothetical protein